MPECLLAPDVICAYITHQLNVCLVLREINDGTMSTDIEDCYIIIWIDSAQVFLRSNVCLSEIVQEALTLTSFIIFPFMEHMASLRVVCGRRKGTGGFAKGIHRKVC